MDKFLSDDTTLLTIKFNLEIKLYNSDSPATFEMEINSVDLFGEKAMESGYLVDKKTGRYISKTCLSSPITTIRGKIM